MGDNFKKIVVCDFEYETCAPPQREGDPPNVLCLVAHLLDENLQHVHTVRQWRGEFGQSPPFDIDDNVLFAGYSCWAEMTCFMRLGWKFPRYIFDQHTAYLATSNILLPHNPDHANACPMPAVLTGSMVGSASTKRRLRKTSARVIGRSTDAKAFSSIAKKTFASRCNYCAGNCVASRDYYRPMLNSYCIGQITAPRQSP
jgi:hypothetical protein